MNVSRALWMAALLVATTAACGKKDGAPQASLASPSGAASGAAASSVGATAGDASPSATAASADLWSAAASLEPEDLSRLALQEGSAGLVAGATDDARRKIAVNAFAYGEDLEALPFLADTALTTKDAALALTATDIAGTLASRRKPSLAPEDALEVREGCDKLTALAKDAARPKPLRAKAIRVLRLLEDRGCARAIPAL